MTPETLATLRRLLNEAEGAHDIALYDEDAPLTPDAQLTQRGLTAMLHIVTALDTADPTMRRSALHNAIANLEFAMRVIPQPPSLYHR